MLTESDIIDLFLDEILFKDNIKFELDKYENDRQFNLVINSSTVKDFYFYIDLIKIDIDYFSITFSTSASVEYENELSLTDQLFIDNIQMALGHYFYYAYERVNAMEIYK